MKGTMFLVTLHGSLEGPVPVPFTESGNWDHLFDIVVKERVLAVKMRRKIGNLTTGSLCTTGKFVGMLCGIRKGTRRDRVLLYDHLRSAHETDAEHFRGRTASISILLIQTLDHLPLTFALPLEEPYIKNTELRMILILVSPLLPT